MKKYTSVQEYFDDQSGIHLEILEKIRKLIMEEAPNAQAVISYGMPSYKTGKVIAGMYAYKNHVSFYPFEGEILSDFRDELEEYKILKGTLQLGINQPFPESIVRKIIREKVKRISE